MTKFKLITPSLFLTFAIGLSIQLFHLPLSLIRMGPRRAFSQLIADLVSSWRYHLWSNDCLPASVTTDNIFLRQLPDGRVACVHVILIGGSASLALMQVQLADQSLGYFYLQRKNPNVIKAEVEFQGISPLPFDQAERQLIKQLDPQSARPVLQLMNWIRISLL